MMGRKNNGMAINDRRTKGYHRNDSEFSGKGIGAHRARM
jgi:hypothetical protein